MTIAKIGRGFAVGGRCRGRRATSATGLWPPASSILLAVAARVFAAVTLAIVPYPPFALAVSPQDHCDLAATRLPAIALDHRAADLSEIKSSP